MPTADVICAIVASIIGALFVMVLNSLRGSIKELHSKMDNIYPWAEKKFASREVCEIRHQNASGFHRRASDHVN